MRAMTHVPLAVSLLRRGVDGIDDAMMFLVAGRRRLVAGLAASKRRAGLPARDPAREDQVLARGQSLARHLGLPPGLARGHLELLIADACRLQEPESGETMSAPFPRSPLRWFPPPRRWAPLLRLVPAPWQRQALEQAVGRLLAQPIGVGDLEFMQDRRLGIEVSDLGLAWVLELDGERLRAVEGEAEASVRGSATDLLLLASRLEDADSLFFQRRLEVTGDTELGLTARNLLDRLPWESVPLGVRILLNRGARAARAAREAWQGGTA